MGLGPYGYRTGHGKIGFGVVPTQDISAVLALAFPTRHVAELLYQAAHGFLDQQAAQAEILAALRLRPLFDHIPNHQLSAVFIAAFAQDGRVVTAASIVAALEEGQQTEDSLATVINHTCRRLNIVTT